MRSYLSKKLFGIKVYVDQCSILYREVKGWIYSKHKLIQGLKNQVYEVFFIWAKNFALKKNSALWEVLLGLGE